MSATIDRSLFTDYFKRVNLGNAYSVYEVEGLQPLYKRIEVKEFKKIDQMQFVDVIYKKINEIILNPALPVGDILAFVTSEPETKKLKNKIDNNLRNYPVNNKPYAIAFSASISDTDKTIAVKEDALKTDVIPTAEAPQGYNRKVIIGTNAVESSVTFGDPLKYVIESGLAYEKKYDAKNYCYTTGKFYVSQASIAQRCGRTGRTCDGHCLQLYTAPQFNTFKKFTDPKILVEDFTKELLGLICLSINGNLQKALDFIYRMIEPPVNYKHSIANAYNNLINMDFIDTAGNLLPLGRVCNSFNTFDIKIAKMCVGGYYLGCLYHCIVLGAILSTVMSMDEIFQKPFNMDEDLALQKQYEANIIRQKNDENKFEKVQQTSFLKP
jgi:HrpA-like RNA helicase